MGGRIITGVVVSTKMKDTVVVSIASFRKHPKYGKYIKRSKRYKAQDTGNTCSLGDLVSIKETKPISKDKHFIVVERKKIAEKLDPEMAEPIAAEPLVTEADSSQLEAQS